MPFRDFHGHRRIADLLSRSIGRGTLPPSLIFAGDGTRDMAIAVAQALNCQAPVPGPESSVDACGRCVPCRRIARGVHPDVLVVEPGDTGAIKIDQIRDVVDRAGYRPFEGRRRVVIIHEAESLMAAAQNALLKTLEEPPPSTMFVLVTAMPDLLLPTVRSRCIRLTFAATGDVEIDREARVVAERALISAASTRDVSGRIDAARELHPKGGDTGAAAREQLASYLDAMASLLRDAEVVATRAEVPLANADDEAVVERLARTYSGARGVRAYAAIDRALEALARNAGAKVVADWIMLQL
jgi:DNA polymerase III subunit delta'